MGIVALLFDAIEVQVSQFFSQVQQFLVYHYPIVITPKLNYTIVNLPSQ